MPVGDRDCNLLLVSIRACSVNELSAAGSCPDQQFASIHLGEKALRCFRLATSLGIAASRSAEASTSDRLRLVRFATTCPLHVDVANRKGGRIAGQECMAQTNALRPLRVHFTAQFC